MQQRYLICTFVLILGAFGLFAQETLSDKKKQATNYYYLNKYQSAQSVLIGIKKNRQEDKETKLLLALCYYHLNQLKEAEPMLRHILETERSPFPETWLYLGKIYHDRHEFTKAIEYYKLYLKAIPSSHANRATIREDIRRCATGLALQYKTPRAIVENLGNTVNTVYDEFAPIMSPNFTDRIYFSSVRPGNVGGSRNNFGQPDEVMGRFYSDIFTSQVNKGIWTPPQAMHHLLNSPKHEVLLDFSANGKALFYFKGNSYTQGEILIDTFRVGSRTLSSDPFIGPVEATAGLSSAQFIGDTMVIFASQRPGGYGGLDLYKTVWVRGRWSAPVNLGPDINSTFDETTPFLSRNGQVLYFSSNRPDQSMGGFDVFRCLLIPQINRWTNADNLGVPVNSAGDDTHFRLSRDGYTAYFASSRKDGLGERDIYAAYFFDYLHEMSAPITNTAPVYVQTSAPPKMPRTNPDGSLAEPDPKEEVAPRGSLMLKPFYFNQDGQWMQNTESKQLDELIEVLKKNPQLKLVITAASRQEMAVSSRLYGGLRSAENLGQYFIGKGVSPTALQLHSIPPPPDFTSNFKTLTFQLSGLGESAVSSKTEPWLSGYTEDSGLVFRIQVGQSTSVLQNPLLSQDKYAMGEKSLSNGTYYYTIGRYNGYTEAKTALSKLSNQTGFATFELVPYVNGIRLSRETAGSLSKMYPDVLTWLEQNN